MRPLQWIWQWSCFFVGKKKEFFIFCRITTGGKEMNLEGLTNMLLIAKLGQDRTGQDRTEKRSSIFVFSKREDLFEYKNFILLG